MAVLTSKFAAEKGDELALADDLGGGGINGFGTRFAMDF